MWPDKIIPPPFNFCLPVIVENKLALSFLSSKVLKELAPNASSFFSQYSIKSILDVPETVWNFINSDKIFKVSGNASSRMLFFIVI